MPRAEWQQVRCTGYWSYWSFSLRMISESTR